MPEQFTLELDLEPGSTHTAVVGLVGRAGRVLELGPATGYMSQVFRDQGSAVVGVEIDPHMAEHASEFCERMIVADLDALDFERELGEDRFDAIVAADVLEHLKDPLRVLRALRTFLTEDGAFVVSLPNIAHGSVRLALLGGVFPYQDLGLLDRTHLRFFTRQSIEQLFDDAELGIVEMRRQELEIDASEVPFEPVGVPAELKQRLEDDPDSRTYQFVIRAIPLERAGLRGLQARMRELALARSTLERQLADHERTAAVEADRLRQAIDAEAAQRLAAASRVSELEAAVAALGAREGEVRGALVSAHDQLLHRDEQIERLQREVEDTQARGEAQLAAWQDQAKRLRVRLERILESPPGRAYAAVKSLPGLRQVAARRQQGYLAALRRGGSANG
jgi:2-polyprenyl-3-methyl-5-hydroxy-6-metoxy-1,4-benzoquinol methylase